MAAGKRVSKRESAYLVEENATKLWCFLFGETRFTRRPVKERGTVEKLNHRLLYLMAAALFRSMQRLVTVRRWRRALDTVEAYADGEATSDELFKAYEAGEINTSKLPAANAAAAQCICFLPDDCKVDRGVDFVSDAAGYLGAVAAGVLAPDEGLGMPPMAVWQEPAFQDAKRAHEKKLCALIRDIFGNPYRKPPVLDRSWLAWNGGTIPKLAQTMYASKRFHDLPILGDALEEAGCTDEAVLAHCRGPGPHVRGCWVVDWILEKE
jgi:hypothetical protein